MMALLLWVGGALAFLARMPQLGIAIWAVNVLNGLFSFWQEYRAEKATAALQRLLPRTATVIRQGQQQRVGAEALVPGDVLLLSAGDLVPADARLISANRFQVNQSTLTGESTPAAKTADCPPTGSTSTAEHSNLVFAGTSVSAGVATAVVFATGMNTTFGGITRLTQSLPDSPSPLQRELTHATKIITLVALGVGSICFMIAVLAANLSPPTASFSLWE
jgi:P-type E1-E2 ATPase